MPSTGLAAPMRAALTAIACAFALALLLPVAVQTADAKSPCANRLCTEDKPQTPKCWRYESRKRVSRCFITRAARHFHQSRRQALYIAYRESRFNYKVTNPSSGTAGLYQFARRTWESTPYHKHSPYHPRWAALAAMWMWKHGGQYHWNA